MAKKIIIANSVGITPDKKYIIPYPSRWTTTVSRSPFNFYPWELAYLSSLLKKKTDYSIKLIDGCLERLDFTSYLSKIVDENPDWLVMESSSLTIESDLQLASAVKKRCNTKLIFTGQHPSVFPEEVLKTVDFVCQGEYEHTVLDIITGKKREDILGLYPNRQRPLLDINSLPWPEDDDIARIDYATPTLPGSKYIQLQMYTSRGCPLMCKYCVSSNIYYKKPNWRSRNIDDIIAEIKYLKNKYTKIEGLFFDEEFHNVDRKFILSLTDAIIKNRLDHMKLTAMCAYYTLDDDVLEAMKKAGYYQIKIGIETASEKIANSIGLGPKFNLKKLIPILKKAKKLDIEMYGTFTIGAPASSREEDLKTVELIKKLLTNGLLSEMQVSICTPQPGTPFYKTAEEHGYLITKDWKKFDGSAGSVISFPHYKKEEIEKVYQSAVDIGHHYRALQGLKRDGWIVTIRRIISRIGILGVCKHFVRRLISILKGEPL